MKLLAVETSSPIFSAAVCDGPDVKAFLQVEGQGRPSSLLTDLMEQVLGKAGLRLSDLDGFALSIGPGSFTGLRIGVMTLKTMAWALKKPVLPVSSLEVVARNADPSSRDLLVLVDARRGNVYSALFSPNGKDSLRRIHPDELLSPEEALKKIQRPVRVIGDGLKKYWKQVAELGVERAEQTAPELWVPRADTVVRIAEEAWPEGQVDDPHTLVPQYFYLP